VLIRHAQVDEGSMKLYEVEGLTITAVSKRLCAEMKRGSPAQCDELLSE